MVFGASADVSGLPDSADEKYMISLVQKAWASFARDPSHGLTSVMEWLRYMPESEYLPTKIIDNTS